MTTGNSLNISTKGTLYNNNAGSISGETFTAFSVVCAGTASDAQLQNVSGLGSSGQVLTSQGASALPQWATNSAAGAVLTVTGDSGGPEAPSANNFNLLGSGSITTTGSAATETISLQGLTSHNILVGAGTSTIGKIAPSATSGIALISQGVSADPIFSTVVVAGGGSGGVSYTPYSLLTAGTGSTSPFQNVSGVGTSGQVLTSQGASALPVWSTNSAAGAVLTITGNDSVAESPSANNFNIVGSGSIATTGSAATETIALTGLTNHNLLIGAGTATITKVAPSATSGVPVISQGSSADPTFGTAVVAGGGTGGVSYTAFSLIAAGTTSTGAFQNVSGVGTSGQLLQSQGAGALPQWATVSSGSGFTSITVQTFTSSGTYTPTSGMKYCVVEICGGGAGGGGITLASTVLCGGGGGGAGGYAKKTFAAATIGASQSFTLGAGGTGGSSGTVNGAAGTASTFGTGPLLTANGADFATSFNAASPSSYFHASLGGTASGGDVNISGMPGGIGTYVTTITSVAGPSGFGGNSQFGAGGPSDFVINGANMTLNGIDGTGYGSGGSGAVGAYVGGSPPTASGGNGKGGFLIVTEYIS